MAAATQQSRAKTKRAERNNNQLFPIFFKNFQTGSVTEFATTADKFANWLMVDKAYYPKARPTIVDLLETALDTVRRHSGNPELSFHISRLNDEVRPYADPFVRLVRTVVPFYPLFPEPPLQMRLRAIFQTICDNVVEFLSQQPALRSSSTTPSIVTTTPSVHNPNVSVTLPSTRVLTPQGDSVQAPLTKINSESSGSSGIISSIPSPAAPVMLQTGHRADSDPMLPTATPQSTRSKAKKVKLALDVVFEADLNWYKDKQSTKAGEPGSPQPASQPALDAVTSSANTSTLSIPQLAHTTQLRPGSPPVEAPQSTDANFLSAASSTAKPDNKTSRLSMSSQDTLSPKFEPPSAPLRPEVKMSLKRKASQELDSKEDSTPDQGSPMVLPPSFTRITAAVVPSASVTNAPAPTNAMSVPSETLPSPFAIKKEKKEKKKRRKGPPGLKVLPIHPLTEQQVKEEPNTDSGLESLPVVHFRESPSKKNGQLKSASKSPSRPPSDNLPQDPSMPPFSTSDLIRTVEPSPATVQGTSPVSDTAMPTVTSAPSSPVLADSVLLGSLVLSPPVVDSQQGVAIDKTVTFASPDATDRAIKHTPAPDAMEVDEASEPSQFTAAPDFVIPNSPEEEKGVTILEDTFMQVMARSPPRIDPSIPLVVHVEESSGASVLSNSVFSAPSTEDSGHHVAASDNARGFVSPASTPHATLSSATTNGPLQNQIISVSPFASKVVRLLSLGRGQSANTFPKDTLKLTFHLTEEEMTHVARWNNRKKFSNDLPTSLCISLVSYPLEQCEKVSQEVVDEKDEIAVVAFGSPLPWPQDGSLYVVLGADEERSPSRSFTVAPPFGFNTIHRPVDIGGCVIYPGRNTCQLCQYRGHSDRIFAVVLHHPTVEQLNEAETVSQRERALEDWIEGLGKFDTPVPRLTTQTATV